MRVLIVEDNVKTANFLSKGLKEHYFLPDIALNGQEGLFLANEHSYDVMILDILLPCLDGWDLVQLIRKKNKQILILFLTACDGVEDRVKGLALGADDYLVKPFSFSELLARIQSLARRRDQQQGISEWISVADLKIDLLKNRVTRSDLQGLRMKKFEGQYESNRIKFSPMCIGDFGNETRIRKIF